MSHRLRRWLCSVRAKRGGVLCFALVGMLSLVWFLVRVIPKPSRARYPCQRVAAPLASSFVLWLVGLLGSAVAFRKARERVAQARYVLALFCVAVGVAAAWFGLVGGRLPNVSAWLRPSVSPTWTDPPNDPIGIARGANPGRVVWVHNPDATDWAGPGMGDGYWWDVAGDPVQPVHIDQSVVDTMMSQAVQWLAGSNTDAEAWDTLFRYFNQQRGKGDVGYQPGEKIVIKTNFALSHAQGDRIIPETRQKNPASVYVNGVDTSHAAILALLRQLVNVVGVAQSDITVGDTGSYFPKEYYDVIVEDFPDVWFLDHWGFSLPGYRKPQFSSVPFYFSTSAAAGCRQDYLPVSYADADYLINFACLKGHAAGITLCGKNHYGSLIRTPSCWLWGAYDYDYYEMHADLPYITTGLGHYRTLVDLMAHKELGQKTVLYLIDGLFGGDDAVADPVKWQMPPFNDDWPSSLFASQDPVAIDSVGYDFLIEEWPVIVNGAGDAKQGGAQDYLHEAAQLASPPSGTTYDPDGDGTGPSSLGVHEHWNNPIDRQYTRNLGTGYGIELITSTPLILGVSVEPGSYAFGPVDPGSSTVSATALVVTNTGNAEEDIGIRIKDEDDQDEWTAGTAGGENVYALFTRLAETAGTFAAADRLTTTVQWCDGTVFGGGGNDMAASATVNQWFQFAAPTSVTGDHATAQHTITVELSCRVAE